MTVSYSIPRSGRVRLGIYDANGRLVRRLIDGDRRAGGETVVWDGKNGSGSDPGAGIHFIRLAGPGSGMTRKLALLR